MPTDRSIPPTDPISTWDNNYNLPVETDSYFNEKFGKRRRRRLAKGFYQQQHQPRIKPITSQRLTTKKLRTEH
ncbi:hypothetical protein PPACK8108_LOCUS17784 [Phakopsora pachyrhizi]|uniref:Uncharacterized protein n=1 Tax=Phakopsora pachyrhizi TaxID=170000 RepID=A0AAV0BF12_PHAPC|nr:hypothetical protein PPACK8108_LOCUS17784 [Phakopsora pachyrhizi]